MKKNYFKFLFFFALVTASTMFGQTVSNVIINGTAGTGTDGKDFATPVKAERGSDMVVTFTLTHATNKIERAFMVIKTGSPGANPNIGNPYNNIEPAPGFDSPYTETDAKYAIPGDAALGMHTLRLNGRNYEPGATAPVGWPSATDITIEIVEAGSLSTEKFNAFEFNTYPNPVKDQLFISSKETINKVEVFNLLGKKVLSVNDVKGAVEVSSLSKSIYILKLTSDKGVSTKRFVKQ